LKLKILNVSRKGGTWDLACDPILVAFIADLVLAFLFAFVLVSLEMLSIVAMGFF